MYFTEVLKESSVARLEGMLKHRYGLGLRLASIVDAQDVEIGDSRGEIRGDSLYITLASDGKYLATAILADAKSLPVTEVPLVTEMVRLVLEPTLYASFLAQADVVTKIDDHAQNSNVIELFEDVKAKSEWVHEGPEFLTSIMMLQSTNPQTIQRVAVHIHELGERWALVNFRDVRSQVQNTRLLRELGAMTIVIDDIVQLSRAEQHMFMEFAANPVGTKTEPLILVGSTQSISDLAQRGQVEPELLMQLRRHHLELDRLPKEFSRLQEALELFLDRQALLI